MPTTERFFRSKTARQVFLLVLISSVVPTVLVFACAATAVRGYTRAQVERRMDDATRLLGMQLTERFAFHTRALGVLASELQHRAADGSGAAPRLDADFDWVGVVAADGRMVSTLHGVPPPGDRVDGVASSTVLAVDQTASEPAVQFVVPLGRPDGPRKIVGRVAPAALLGPLVRALPERALVALLDDAGRVVFSSQQGLPASLFEASRLASPRHLPFNWGDGPDARVGYSRPLVLEEDSGVPPWTLVLAEPRTQVMVPTARLWRMLPSVLGLSIAAVCFVAAIQIRRRAAPLDELSRAAQRLAQGDLAARAELPPTDELGQLAQTFNAMAAQIERDFHALATRAEIDRAVLSSLDRHEIASKLLHRLPGLVPCDGLAVTLIDGVCGERHSLVEGHAVRPQREEIVFGSEELEFLACLGDPVGARTLSDVPAAFRPPCAQSDDTWVFPVPVRGTLGAVIAISRRQGQVVAHHHALMGQLVTQFGIGLTNSLLLEEVDRANWEMVEALSRAIDAKSPWTAGHSTRVTMIGLALARRLGLEGRELEAVHRGGLLHDIGKLGIPVEILDKPGHLSPDEMAIMRQHTAIGARIVEPISAYADVVAAVRHHHEHYDGDGYPDGLKGEGIPLIARIFAVADVFDSLCSPRPYREAWHRQRVIDYMVEGAGSQFDPHVVDALLAELPGLPAPISAPVAVTTPAESLELVGVP